MAINSDRLSLWEIAFRWHDLDPHAYESAENIPLEVKDTLRILAAAIYNERLISDLWMEREETADYRERKEKQRNRWFSRKEWPRLALSDYRKEFSDCLERNIIDPAFLKQIMISNAYLRIWCGETGTPMPPFWKRFDASGQNQSQPEETAQATESNPEKQGLAQQTNRTARSQQQQAANKRHEAGNQLKRECAVFCLARPDKSAPLVANLFHSNLPDHKKRILGKPTLETAIRDFRKRDKLEAKGKLPTWLIDFDPSPTQK